MVSINDVCDYMKKLQIRYEIKGNRDVEFNSFCPLNCLKPNSITWVRNAELLCVEKLNLVRGLILVANRKTIISGALFPIIYVDDPHKVYFMIIDEFFKEDNPDYLSAKIERSAVVETKKIGKGVYIGHHSYIGSDVEIGSNVRIHHNVTIQGKVVIGDNTVIESGASIGVFGYGPYWDNDNNPILVPHLGNVIIGKHVYIGANTCIVRGCLGSTTICDYVKIDNLVHIAHNVTINKGAMIVANSIICGSATVDEGAWVAPGAVVNEALRIEKNSILGIGAIVIKDVPEHMVAVGNPARILREKKDGEL